MDEFKKLLSSKEILIAFMSAIFTCLIGGLSWYNNQNYSEMSHERAISELKQDNIDFKTFKATTSINIALLQQSLQAGQQKTDQTLDKIEHKVDTLMERK